MTVTMDAQIKLLRDEAVIAYQVRLNDFLARWATEMPVKGGSTRNGVEWAADIVAKSVTDPDILDR